MKKKIFFCSLLVVLLGGYFTSCKKDLDRVSSTSKNGPMLKNMSFQLGGASYNSQHNVFVFNSFDGFNKLTDDLEEANSKPNNDNGNTNQILQMISDIKQYGVYNGNNPNSNKVKVSDFELLLDNSFPLSDQILIELIELREIMNINPPVIKNTLIDNADFSGEVVERLRVSTIPTGIKNQILNADSDNRMGFDHGFEAFLENFPSYTSLFSVLKQEKEFLLDNGGTPFDEEFRKDYGLSEAQLVLFNDKKEVYIDEYLIKLLDDCRIAILQGSIGEVYQDLTALGPNGELQIPSGIQETNAGLSNSIMNQYVPSNMVIISAFEDDLQIDDKTGAINFDEYNSGKFSDCPQSLFSYSEGNYYGDISFNSYTDLNYQGQTFFQYWDFGDGTGSFQEDPYHTYPGIGTYKVRLITFNSSCGCWDVKSTNIIIGDNPGTYKACYIDGSISPVDPNDPYTYEVSVNGYDDNVGVFVDSIVWNWGDGNTETTVATTNQHTFPTSSFVEFYDITVTMHFSNGCAATLYIMTHTVDPSSEEDCCETYAIQEDYAIPANNAWNSWNISNGQPQTGGRWLTYKDQVKGNSSLWGLWKGKIYAKQTMVEFVPNKGFKKRKADHDIKIQGPVNHVDEDLKCENQQYFVFHTDSKDNDKSVTFKYNPSNLQDFAVEEEVLTVTHTVKYNGLTVDVARIFGAYCD